jgi:uncharacterized lipoprotein YddW (UPF0748 family)
MRSEPNGKADLRSRRDALAALTGLATAALAQSAVAAAAFQPGPGQAPSGPPAAPAIRREFRGVWVATVDNIDWPSDPTPDASTLRAQMRSILDLARALRLNAIVLQVRPTADAIYASRLEPWSAFLTGAQGRPPEPSFDPLAEWIAEAHARGLDLHAWINPFRVRHPKSIGPDVRGHVANARPDLVRSYNGYLWLDPGEPEARAWSMRVVEDLLRRYDLDGVHVDDYFYPYPAKDQAFPDRVSYDKARAAGESRSVSDWRRANIDGFVRTLYETTHRIRPHALVGISPFGIWRPNHPAQVRGFDAYEGLHADSRRWVREGWLDYIAPQLYWKVDAPQQPFVPLLNWWLEQNESGRHVWPGLYATRVLPEGDNAETGWNPEEIVRQVRLVQQSPGATGSILFSMIGLTQNRRGLADMLASGPFAEPALIPESPWLAARRPGRPLVQILPESAARTPGVRPSTLRILPTPESASDIVRNWSIRVRYGSRWNTDVLPGSLGQIRIPASVGGVPAARIELAGVGPCGAEGPARVMEPRG